MQNIKLTLQYDGTRYLGWKRPEKDHNDRTVSYKIENVSLYFPESEQNREFMLGISQSIFLRKANWLLQNLKLFWTSIFHRILPF